MIGIQGARAPSIPLELLSSRVQLKHELHVPTKGRAKWSPMRDSIERAWTTCCEHVGEVRAVA
eukprot:9207705-Pyramimonas_sp.AAC.1